MLIEPLFYFWPFWEDCPREEEDQGSHNLKNKKGFGVQIIFLTPYSFHHFYYSSDRPNKGEKRYNHLSSVLFTSNNWANIEVTTNSFDSSLHPTSFNWIETFTSQ